jgi:hypothetical protein
MKAERESVNFQNYPGVPNLFRASGPKQPFTHLIRALSHAICPLHHASGQDQLSYG